MTEPDLNIKDIIDRTKSFDQPYAPAIPEGIHEVDIQSFERKPSSNGYDMLVITVADHDDRTARVNQMLELQWIEGTIRLIKGLYTRNTPEAEKEAAKDKINKFFDSAKNETDLQDKCIEILKKLIEKGCIGWLKVEFNPNKDSKYPDRQLTSYEPTYRWRTTADEAEDIVKSGEPIEVDESLFK